jgi:hypothetical protein
MVAMRSVARLPHYQLRFSIDIHAFFMTFVSIRKLPVITPDSKNIRLRPFADVMRGARGAKNVKSCRRAYLTTTKVLHRGWNNISPRRLDQSCNYRLSLTTPIQIQVSKF